MTSSNLNDVFYDSVILSVSLRVLYVFYIVIKGHS